MSIHPDPLKHYSNVRVQRNDRGTVLGIAVFIGAEEINHLDLDHDTLEVSRTRTDKGVILEIYGG